MRAIVLQEFGGVQNLTLEEISSPIAEDHEVLIRVKAISINPVDVRTRAGSAMANFLKGFKPLILGWDIAGVVTEIGSKATRFKIGDEFFGMVNFLGHGKAYAEFVSTPEDHISLKPKNQTFETAAAATLAASGGVGHYAVQIAKHYNAFVIGVSSLQNRNFVLDLGADRHVAYNETSVEDVISDMDIVIDAFSGDGLHKSLKMVRNGGTIISLLPFISEEVLKEAKSRNVNVHYELVRSSGPDMTSISNLLESGAITSHVSQVYDFTDMAKAHIAMETGKTVGKIVVTLDW